MAVLIGVSMGFVIRYLVFPAYRDFLRLSDAAQWAYAIGGAVALLAIVMIVYAAFAKGRNE